MNESIFKAYDIRGIYPGQINEEVSYAIARSFVVFIKELYKIEKPKIIIGKDTRTSSEKISQAVIRGLSMEGSEVIDIGLCTTPLNYFANFKLKADGSIMITASHNPKEYNGLKLSLRGAKALAEIDGVDTLKRITLNYDFEDYNSEQSIKPQDKSREILEEYLDFLEKEAEGIDFSDLRIVVDCGNGMVGPIWEKLSQRLNINYDGLFLKPNGLFPNHQPNPLDKTAQQEIRKLMKRSKFDIGFIFDGDGDRLMAFDSLGEPIRNDFLLGVLAKKSFSKIENKNIVIDARLSRGVEEEMSRENFNLIKSKVGYPNVKRLMRKREAFLGGELSGHFFWQDFGYAESVLLSSLRLLKTLSLSKKTITELVQPFKTYFNSGEINFQVLNKNKKLKELEKEYSDGEISHIDGVTVEYKSWWFNARPSNTEPLLRLVVEAKTQEILSSKVEELSNLIKN